MNHNNAIDYLQNLLEYVEYYNRMAPFPVFDTEYVSDIKNKLEKMKEKKFDYDTLPVAACKHCKLLKIIVDELDNDVCLNCGSVNEIKIYKNIFEYKEQNEDN